MPRKWSLVAPVPQWQVPADWKGCSFKPGFRVERLNPSRRRALLDALKREDGYSEQALSLLTCAETVALAKGPLQAEHGRDVFLESLWFTYVADAFLRRLHECVNLFLVFPAPPDYWHSCWFLVERDRGATTAEKVRCLDHSWMPDTRYLRRPILTPRTCRRPCTRSETTGRGFRNYAVLRSSWDCVRTLASAAVSCKPATPMWRNRPLQ